MNDLQRVLLIDPAARARELLAADGQVLDHVTTGGAGLDAAGKSPPTAVVLARELPDRDGFDVLRSLHREHPELPIVLTTAAVAPTEIVAAMKAGAWDVVAWPADEARLATSVRSAAAERANRRDLDRLRAEAGGLRLDDVLKELIVKGGSDLHLKVGRPPMFRIAGDLVPSGGAALSEADVQGMLLQVLGPSGFRGLEEHFESDSSYLLGELARFRVNAFKRMGQYGAAFRLIPLTVPTIEMMKLPPVLKEICKAPQGLVLVTGPTGSGKSTTLAAMMDHLNETQPLHVVTIEDPVEFVYEDKKCTINQRQLGNDVKSLNEALRRVLRQDPDVILMGEMRDRETMELAMRAAETGHLVFSTLHTNDAKQTIDRIIDSFPPDTRAQVRAQLAHTLHAVVGQRLVKRADGPGRIAAVEVMIASPQIRELIAEGKTSAVEKAIAGSGDYYRMQTFNQALARLVQDGSISPQEALASSATPGDLRLMLRGFSSGGTTTMAPRPATGAAAHAPEPALAAGGFKITRGF
jgi:twitching motility protein PilT